VLKQGPCNASTLLMLISLPLPLLMLLLMLPLPLMLLPSSHILLVCGWFNVVVDVIVVELLVGE